MIKWKCRIFVIMFIKMHHKINVTFQTTCLTISKKIKSVARDFFC